MGLDRDRFVGLVNEEFICSICLDVIEEPRILECEHLFCHACIEPVVSRDRSCPNCRQTICASPKQPLRMILNQWKALPLKCQYFARGCQSQVTIETMAHHSSRCDFNPANNITCNVCGIRGADVNSHRCVDVLKISVDRLNEELKTFKDLATANIETNATLETCVEELKEQLDIKDTVINDQLEQMRRHLEIKDKRILELQEQLATQRMQQMQVSQGCATGGNPLAPAFLPRIEPDVRKLNVARPYHWDKWSVLKGNVGADFLGEFLYVWSDFVALQLGDASYGILRYFMDGAVYSLNPEGVAKTAANHERTMFLDKLSQSRSQVEPGERWSHEILRSSEIQSSSGVWTLCFSKPGEVIIKNQWEPQLLITLRRDYNGFIFTSKDGTNLSFRAGTQLPKAQFISLREGPETRKPFAPRAGSFPPKYQPNSRRAY